MYHWNLQLVLFISISMLILSCIENQSVVNQRIGKEKNQLEQFDSANLYLFFKDKVTTSFDDTPENDSVIYNYDQYGLPEFGIEYYTAGSSLAGEICSKRIYHFNITDSTETIKHVGNQGGVNLTEIKKFDKNGKILWEQQIDMNRDEFRTYYHYDNHGKLIQRVELDWNFGDTIRVVEIN